MSDFKAKINKTKNKHLKASKKRVDKNIDAIKEKRRNALEYSSSAILHELVKKETVILLVRLILSFILLVIGAVLIQKYYLAVLIFIAAFLLIGYDVLIKAVIGVIGGKIFQLPLLMSVAGIAAMAIGSYGESVLLMIISQLSGIVENILMSYANSKVKKIFTYAPGNIKLVKEDDHAYLVPAEEAQVGDVFIVMPGDKIPLDGVVVGGEGEIDISLIAGDQSTIRVEDSDKVLAGSVNITNTLRICATSTVETCSASKAISCAENGANEKSRTEKFVFRLSNLFTPIVFFISLIIGGIMPLILGESFVDWIYRAVTFIIIASPLSFVIASTLVYSVGAGTSIRRGIIYNGHKAVDNMTQIGAVVLDDTEILNAEEFEIISVTPETGYSQEQILEYAAYAAYPSKLNLSKSVCKNIGTLVDVSRISNHVDFKGKGSIIQLDARVAVTIGNLKMMNDFKIRNGFGRRDGKTVYVAVGTRCIGCIEFGDKISQETAVAVKQLAKYGAKRIVMMTKKQESAAYNVAQQAGIKEVYSHFNLNDRADYLKYMASSQRDQKRRCVAAVTQSDKVDLGILTSADITIGLGGFAAEEGIRPADVILISRSLDKVNDAIKIAKKIRLYALENIAIALLCKIIVLLACVLGYSSIFITAIIELALMITVIFNALRLRVTIKSENNI